MSLQGICAITLAFLAGVIVQENTLESLVISCILMSISGIVVARLGP